VIHPHRKENPRPVTADGISRGESREERKERNTLTTYIL